MKTSDFDFELPSELIAQAPVSPRDHSRLLVLDKKSGETEDKHFYDVVDYLKKGDVLVLNNSKVIPARLIGKRKESGGKVEVFLVKKFDVIEKERSECDNPGIATTSATFQSRDDTIVNIWQCMVGGKRIKPGLVVEFEKGLEAEIFKNNEDGTWEVGFNLGEDEMMSVVEEIGETPLPPYIKKELRIKNREFRDDKNLYQTTFADDDKKGSVAAPTAGLHFTPELMQKLKDKGVQIEYITLHVGLGTFAPVKVDDVKEHKMHSEYVEIDHGTANRIKKAQIENRRVVTVGTTSTRTLEFLIGNLDFNNYLKIKNFTAWVDIFIYPGYEFKIVDAMITNFHLPKSTLIMLVSALAGKKNIDKAYQHAINKHYRFYSYGDAMFITN